VRSLPFALVCLHTLAACGRADSPRPAATEPAATARQAPLVRSPLAVETHEVTAGYGGSCVSWGGDAPDAYARVTIELTATAPITGLSVTAFEVRSGDVLARPVGTVKVRTRASTADGGDAGLDFDGHLSPGDRRTLSLDVTLDAPLKSLGGGAIHVELTSEDGGTLVIDRPVQGPWTSG
jgi:hypothetical protein